MLLHGGLRRHPVKQLELLPILLDDLAVALVVPREHRPGHDEVGAAAESLGYVPGARAATVGDDVAAEAVGGVSAFEHGRQLGVADAGLQARGADGARADAHLDQVGARENKLFDHLAGDDVAGLKPQ